MSKGITTRATDYSKWYTDIIAAAEMADYSPVKGCMVIRPHGYAVWEEIQKVLDRMFKETGHVNAYFPLFIPKSFLSREAEHVAGFAKECAVVTHSRLKANPDPNSAEKVVLDETSRLEEELVIRPTSETIIWSMYQKWIQSYRDLPILINQWANVVRWEMRTRLFLRTTEFLWQEGHTAHATPEEGEAETLRILQVYRSFAEDYMAIPVYVGVKTESEKFAGAVRTYCIEAMMQDGKALQAGTSHNLGQNFAKAFNVTYQSEAGKAEYVWATSWGVSTRLIGALIMAHSDDHGLVLPPRLAPIQVVLVPIWKNDAEKEMVLGTCQKITADWKDVIRFKIDDRDNYRPGWKFNEWEKKGVPVRLEIGPRDVENQVVVLAMRDQAAKKVLPQAQLRDAVLTELNQMQQRLFETAKKFRDEHTLRCDDYVEFQRQIEAPAGFFRVHWCGSAACEARLQTETKATIRCIPLDAEPEAGKCLLCGQPSSKRVLAAKAY
ncbi:proline--tRNA ligase [candidate division KSB1 bacterium]|nr:proline--tRNA ligase [candidate division KSB1 bacterium]